MCDPLNDEAPTPIWWVGASLEATGFEPVCRALQALASPLGHTATNTAIVPPTQPTQPEGKTMTVVPLFPPTPEPTTTDCRTWGELLDDIAWQIEQGHTSAAISRLREVADETRQLPLPEPADAESADA